jgi:hypothetical protein
MEYVQPYATASAIFHSAEAANLRCVCEHTAHVSCNPPDKLELGPMHSDPRGTGSACEIRTHSRQLWTLSRFLSLYTSAKAQP